MTALARTAFGRRLRAAALVAVAALPRAAAAFETEDGRVALHGYYEMQLRWLSDGFDANNWYTSQWAHTLDLELEVSPFPNGIGPFDVLTGFLRVEARYECVFTGCAVGGTYRMFGDRARQAPARNWRDGVTSGFVGNEPNVRPRGRIHLGRNELVTLTRSPLLQPLFDLGAMNVDATFDPVLRDLFAFKKIDTTRDSGAFQMGPWNTESRVEPIGALRSVPNLTVGLPLRPEIGEAIRSKRGAEGLYVPSDALLRQLDDFDDPEVNFSENELAWNHGAGQDEHELKEAYIDAELFDSRLWLRVGKQTIVWGKTELFRTTDQFNPQDIALSSLPSLEESRISLWSARAILSLYDVGPLKDVRLEIAVNLDDFEPIDLGRCGESDTVWLVCGKSTGLWAHGVTGIGLAGEVRPESPWQDSRGIEVGGRVEWRWDRFSFAVSDFWGYSDAPALRSLYFYERRVDPNTGRPLDSLGRALEPEHAERFHPGNRQLFDIVCSATEGVGVALFRRSASRVSSTSSTTRRRPGCCRPRPTARRPGSSEAASAASSPTRRRRSSAAARSTGRTATRTGSTCSTPRRASWSSRSRSTSRGRPWRRASRTESSSSSPARAAPAIAATTRASTARRPPASTARWQPSRRTSRASSASSASRAAWIRTARSARSGAATRCRASCC